MAVIDTFKMFYFTTESIVSFGLFDFLSTKIDSLRSFFPLSNVVFQDLYKPFRHVRRPATVEV